MCLERSIKLLILIITVGSPVQYHITGELFGLSVEKVKKKRMPVEPLENISADYFVPNQTKLIYRKSSIEPPLPIKPPL